jgi:hypothetical protein
VGCVEFTAGAQQDGSEEEVHRGSDRDNAQICDDTVSWVVQCACPSADQQSCDSDAKELVAELEFVWNQIKNNSPSSSDSSPKATGHIASQPRRFQEPLSGTEGPMKVLSPMSEDDEAERESQKRINFDDGDNEDGIDPAKRGGSKWSRKVERALVKLSAEVAALREQITTGREWRARKSRGFGAWIGWVFWIIIKHLLADIIVLSIVLLWMRRRKDRRLEDLVRAIVRLAREYVRKVLPSR